MKYMRILKKGDNVPLSHRTKSGVRVYDGILVGNELYTLKEWEKLTARNLQNLDRYAEPVEINRNKTYWFFGARFAE